MKKFFTLLSMVMLSMTALAGTDNQPNILNGGFEDWGVDADVVASKAVEPRYWHSFTSAYGTFKAFAGDHCFKSEDAHSGSYSAMIKASSVWGVVANGTLTTGRLKAGAMIADDPNNHSELDMSSTEKDRNKDPFYQVLEARPDSIAFWVKYSTGKAGTKANMSAYITDGTYYQAPEDKTYNNIVGRAENRILLPARSGHASAYLSNTQIMTLSRKPLWSLSLPVPLLAEAVKKTYCSLTMWN